MFFDDAFAASHEWLHETVQLTADRMWAHFNVSMADGRAHKLRKIKKGPSLASLAIDTNVDFENFIALSIPFEGAP